MNKKFKFTLYLTSFLLPFLTVLCIYILKHITPFGTETIMLADMSGQYVEFYSELSEKLKNSGSFFYTFTRGLGGNYLCESAYYTLSPLNIILIFFNAKSMPAVMNILIAFKIGIAGFSMYMYINKHYTNKGNQINYHGIYIIFSAAYALSAYFTNYYYNIMWLDVAALFPLIMLSLEYLINQKRPYMYTLLLALAIFSNYYIGFMVCIYCVIYFVYLLFTGKNKLSVIKAVKTFLLYSFLAGCICAIILLPAIYGLTLTSAGSSEYNSSVITHYPFFVSFYRMMAYANPTFPSHPYLYFSTIALLLIPHYAICKNIPLKKRLFKLGILLFMLLSFQFPMLSYIWNGFHQTNGLSGRQSFIFIFVAITICIDTLTEYENFSASKTLIILFADLMLFLVINNYYSYTSVWYCVIINLVIISLYSIVFIKFSAGKKYIILTLILFLEISISAYTEICTSSPDETTFIKQYDETSKTLSLINDNSLYRIKNDSKNYLNESAMHGYNTLSVYSSTSNDNISNFLSKLGYYCSINSYSDISFEPVSAAMLGMKYIISEKNYIDFDSLSLLDSYENNFVYKNNDALSFGYKISHLDSDDFLNAANPFERINLLASEILNEKTLIYEKFDIKNAKITEKGMNIFLYSNKQLENSVFTTETINEDLYYTKIPNTIVFDKNGTDKYIYYIAASPYGGNFQFSDDIDLDSICAYTINMDEYKKIINTLSKEQLNITSYGDDYIYGDLKCTTDGMVLTSIPYDKGWNIIVDGKKVPSRSFSNALLTFNVSAGNHSIKLNYFPYGLKTGIAISIVSIIILIGLQFNVQKINKGVKHG